MTPTGGAPPRPPRPALRPPPDHELEAWRSRVDERLDALELAMGAVETEMANPDPHRQRFISQHDAEELVHREVATATKSDRVKEVVVRYSLEQAGRVVLWATAIVASTLLVGAVGWALHDCAHAPAPAAPAHP